MRDATLMLKAFTIALSSPRWVWARPELRRLALLPMFLQASLSIVLIVVVLSTLPTWLPNFDFFATDETWWSGVLNWIEKPLAFIFKALSTLIALAFAVVVAMILSLVASGTIYERIAERVIKEFNPHFEQPQLSLRESLWTETSTTLANTALYVLGLLVLQVLHFIPVVGSIASTIGAMFWTWRFLTIELSAATFSVVGVKRKERSHALAKHQRASLSFGLGAWCWMFVPGMLPFLVAGATRYLHDYKLLPRLRQDMLATTQAKVNAPSHASRGQASSQDT